MLPRNVIGHHIHSGDNLVKNSALGNHTKWEFSPDRVMFFASRPTMMILFQGVHGRIHIQTWAMTNNQVRASPSLELSTTDNRLTRSDSGVPQGARSKFSRGSGVPGCCEMYLRFTPHNQKTVVARPRAGWCPGHHVRKFGWFVSLKTLHDCGSSVLPIESNDDDSKVQGRRHSVKSCILQTSL